jgi:Xaa-Pro aminopeptidase
MEDFLIPPTAHLDQVHGRLRALMEEQRLDALVTSTAENTYYVSGYASSLAYILPTAEDGAIAVLWRHESAPTLVMTDFEGNVFPTDDFGVELVLTEHWTGVSDTADDGLPEATLTGGGSYRRLAELMRRLPAGARVGVDLGDLSARSAVRAREACEGREVVDASWVFSRARSVKTSWEIDHIRRVCRLTEDAIACAAERIAPGVTEEELRSVHDAHMASQGATVRLSGITIGSTFSIRRWASLRPGQVGDIVKFDSGASFAEYGSDIARVFAIGRVDSETARTYDALRRGHDAVLASVGPGVKCSEVFWAGLNEVKAAGLSNYRRGHVGHGVGLARAVEEWPFVGPNEDSALEPGMVLSLEVPVYSKRTGGLNLEDMVLITDDGAEVLTTLDRGLTVI